MPDARSSVTNPVRAIACLALALLLTGQGRAQDPAPLAEDQWLPAARREARQPRGAPQRLLSVEAADLNAQLESCAARLDRAGEEGDGWRKYLLWAETSRVATLQPVDPATLDRLEVRWRNALLYWNDPQLQSLGRRVGGVIPLVRRAALESDGNEIPRRWARLRDLLEQPRPQDRVPELAQAVADLERIGCASPLTYSIRERFSHPNCVLTISAAWLEKRLAQDVDETFDVSESYAGASVQGSGRISGRLALRPVAADGSAQLRLLFTGHTSSQTTVSGRGVVVQSRCLGTVEASQTLLLDAAGLTANAASAQADAELTYESIAARGTALRRKIACKEVRARRPAAERDFERSFERACVERLQRETDRGLDAFRQTYETAFALPAATHGRFAPIVAPGSDDAQLVWRCWYAEPFAFAAPQALPEKPAAGDAALAIHETFLERHFAALLGKPVLTEASVQEKFGSWLADQSPANAERGPAADSDWKMTLAAAKPITVLLRDGLMAVTLHAESFETGDARREAANVTVRYRPALDGGKLVFARAGAVEVKLTSASADATGRSTGRQQLAKQMIRRRMEPLFPARIDPSAGASAPAGARQQPLAVSDITARDGWLALTLRQ